jgi:outer membrane lipoprotein-sorting protein
MPPAPGTKRQRRRKRSSHAALAALLLFAALDLSACFFYTTYPKGPEAESAIPGWDPGKYQTEKLTAALAERDKTLDSVQSPAVMEYTAPGQHLKAKEDIVMRKPNSMRVEARSPFGVALLLAAQGDDLAIFEPSENRFMRGEATAATLYRYVRIPMAPADAVALLMGLAPRDFVTSAVPDSASNDGAMMVATYGTGPSGIRQLGFTDGNLAMVRDTAADGRVNYEVRYTDYHDIGGVMFPYVVDAAFPIAQSHVRFRYVRPIVNGNIPDSTFVLTPAPGATLMNLSMGVGAFLDGES